MQTINFIYPEDSDIKYHIDTYPDSQKHLVLDTELDHREDITIYTRLSNLDDLWILLQVGDICQRHGVKIDNLYISYLFAARTDRVFSFNEALDVDIVKDCIKRIQVKHVLIFECHSDRIFEGSMHNPEVPYIQQQLFIPYIMPGDIEYVLFPDKGAYRRYGMFSDYSSIFATKKRISKDKLEISFENAVPLNKTIYVVDDLCDGGGTFFAIYNKLQEAGVKEVHLIVAHAIQKEPLIKLAELYKTVTITNSYKDWDKENLPSNIIIKKVYGKV